VLGFIVDLQVAKKRVGSLVGIFFGLMMGLLIGMTLNYLVEFIYETYNINAHTSPDLYVAKEGIKWLVNVFCCFISVIFVIQTKDDFRFIIPYVEFSKQTKGMVPMILDTSVIIDGRIADVATTHIITSPFIVPRFILNELHNIADSSARLLDNDALSAQPVLSDGSNSSFIHISISDTGPGIASEDREIIFDKFHQLDGSVTRAHSGTGLGLAIVRELTRILGGSVTVDGNAPSGATFSVTLPTIPPVRNQPPD